MIIILAAFLCGVLTYGISRYFIEPKYTATASMYVYSDTRRNQDSITTSELTASQELVNTYIVVLKSDTVLNRVISSLNLNITPASIRNNMTAASINGTEAFSISITHSDPELAQKITNTLVTVAPQEIIRVVKAGGVEVIDYAKLPSSPSSPNVARNTAIGMLIGFVVTFGVYLLIVMLVTKVHNEDELALVFTIPVLGIIPMLADRENNAKKAGTNL